ncbi:hypothetical protein DM77_3448 [Burkholderia mallei]|nr:hypothetical protein DM77_3448 [Burkholderia mallei]
MISVGRDVACTIVQDSLPDASISYPFKKDGALELRW